jgi:3-hydroxyisobutyrate dehydrogenase-like beta-hydroxyacid dehydrogenase
MGPGTSDRSPVAPVGFIGLGNIGAPIASTLTGWPGGLLVCDVVAAACTPLVEAGARALATPAAVAAAGASVISVMVRDDDQVEAVVTGPDGIVPAAAPGTIVAIHSTIGADTAARLAAEVAEAGVVVVDAPVSGGVAGATQANLAVMVGGPAEAVERCRPVFDAFAGLVVHTGPVGSATRAKVARNLLTFISLAATGEAQRLAEAAGVSLEQLGAVVRHTDAITGGPGMVMLRDTTGSLPPEDWFRPIMEHTRDLGEKDLQLALDLAAELGVAVPLTDVAARELPAALGVPHEAGPHEAGPHEAGQET